MSIPYSPQDENCGKCKYYWKVSRLVCYNGCRIVDNPQKYKEHICVMPVVEDWGDFPLPFVTEDDMCECFTRKEK